RRASARRSGVRTQSRAGLQSPYAVLLDDLAVDLEPTAASQVLDHVPVDGAPVEAAHCADSRTDREVDRAVHLLVEQRVLGVALDPGVAADPELTEPACPLVGVERGDQVVLVQSCGGVDDLSALEAEPDVLTDLALVDGRELPELDHSLGGVLDRGVEELA